MKGPDVVTAVGVSVLNAKVRCTPEGQATHVFTLVNPSVIGVTVDVGVQADAGAATGWFTLVGSTRRTLGARGAEQVIVQTYLPAGTAVGVYTFQLVVRVTQGAGERVGVSPRAAVQVISPVAAPTSTHAAGTSRWIAWSLVWPSWLRRCFVMPSFWSPVLVPSPPTSGTGLPGWLVKGMLGLFMLLFFVALGKSVVAAVKTTAEIDPEKWLEDSPVVKEVKEKFEPKCSKSGSESEAEAIKALAAKDGCSKEREADKSRCEARTKLAVVEVFGCAGKNKEYWE